MLRFFNLLLCLIMFNSFQASSVYLTIFCFFLFFGFKLSMYNKNRNRGLAFVEMGSPEEASEALNSLQSYVCKPNIQFECCHSGTIAP